MNKSSFLLIFSLIILPLIVYTQQSYAIDVALAKGESIEEPRTGWLPYLFRTESLGTALGVGVFSAGKKQPQSGIFGTAYATSNDSYLVMGSITNFKLVEDGRLFFNIFALLAHFTDQRFYVDLDQDQAEAKAGSNDSDKDDFVTGISNDIDLEFTLKYVFQMGNALDDPVSLYYLDNGILSSGPQGGNIYDPWSSGKTEASATLFYRYRDLAEITREDLLTVNTAGIKVLLDHNNTDFTRNPSYGSRQKFTLTRDFGWLNQSTSWTNLEVELSKYINLHSSIGGRQKVLALNFWTSNTTSWQTDLVNTQQVSHRPPPGMGSFLGGYDRMRAFPVARFQDKAAVYYSAEFRLIPRSNPIGDIPLLQYFNIDWLQFVGFVEAGRVGPSYNSKLFTEDLKLDAGISLRLMVYHAVVRVGWAVSQEGNSIWAMYEQTFGR